MDDAEKHRDNPKPGATSGAAGSGCTCHGSSAAMKPYLLGYDDAAAYLGMTTQALRDKCYKNGGPAKVVDGRFVRFRVVDLEKWADDRVAAMPQQSITLWEASSPSPGEKRRRGRPTKQEQIARQNRMSGARGRS